MKHLGDIKKINGAEIEPVDVVTGGSPCQDLSVAGKRAGLAEEVGRLEKENTRYRCVVEAIESRIYQRRADIQEMSKRLYQVMHTANASLKFCEDMGKCIDMEEHYANTVD